MLGFDFFCVRNLLHQKATKDYLPAPGYVERYRIENTTNFFTRAVHPQVTLRYSYRVNGHDFSGSVFRYNERIPAQFDAEVLAEGQNVSVYYNSDNPKDAVLARTFTPNDLHHLPLLALFNLMMCSLLGLWLRGRVRQIFHPPRLWQS